MTRQPEEARQVDTAAFDTLPLDVLEEACGELHRRIAVALRAVGERHGDEGAADSPRRLVAGYAASIELACIVFAACAAGVTAPAHRVDRHPATVAALIYGAPTIGSLLDRLEQDRRMLTALARRHESRLGDVVPGPWGDVSLRRVLTEVTLGDASRCAQQIEARLETLTAGRAPSENPDADLA